jgi:hypothetical protein
MTTIEALRSAARRVAGRLSAGLRLIVPALGGHHPQPIPVRVEAQRRSRR